MRISDWSSDVCSSDLPAAALGPGLVPHQLPGRRVEVDLADGCTRSGAAEGPGTEHGALVGERGQRDRPPLAEAADLVLRGHPGVGQEHLVADRPTGHLEIGNAPCRERVWLNV